MSTPLTSLSGCEQLTALQTGEVDSVSLVEAHINRAKAVDERLNSLAIPCFEQALEAAFLADQKRASGEPCGVLHGLPITIKENIATKGQPLTLGLEARQHSTASTDAVVVAQAKREGAIVLAKTNVPQLLLSFECENPLYGTTKNPWDLSRSCGGSSGGEATAIAAGISPCGIGTDIGGSIRIPAAWCGITGLKPTSGLWSSRGIASAIPGQEVVRASAGPLARCTDDLWLMMRALAPQKQHLLDPRVPPLPFSKRASLKGVRVGMVTEFPFFSPSRAIIDAIVQAASALEKQGATVVPFVPAHTRELISLYLKAVSADGGDTIRAALGKEEPSTQLKTLLRVAALPAQIRHLISRGLELSNERRSSLVLRALGRKSVQELWALTAQRSKAQAQELDIWNQHKLDLMLGPATVTVAAHLGSTGDWTLGAVHTMRSNLLDQPAGVVPVGRIKSGQEQPRIAGDRLDKKAAKFEHKSSGLPLSVQVTGRPWQEATVLCAMSAIEQDCAGREDHPFTPINPK